MRRANLAAERARRGWTLAEAAYHSGVSINTYLEWEKGTGSIRSQNLERLSALYGCPIEYLLKQEDQTPVNK